MHITVGKFSTFLSFFFKFLLEFPEAHQSSIMYHLKNHVTSIYLIKDITESFTANQWK